MGLQPLRQAALQPLLQVLHREGVGRPDVGDPRRVGRPAHQGPVVLPRRQGGVLRQQGQQGQALIDEFNYPRYGPGQMWETMTDDIESLGGQVLLNTPVEKLVVEDGRVQQGDRRRQGVRVQLRDQLAAAAQRRRHGRPAAQRRGRLGGEGPALPRLPHGVAGARRGGPVPGQLDLHPRARGRGRPDPELPLLEPVDGSRPDTKACVGLEYFCFAGDELWEMDDDKLVELGMRELEQLGLAKPRQARVRLRDPRARRPTRCTTSTTPSAIDAIRGWLDGIENLQQVGRNGLHRYNNSDHSMLTAMRAVDNLVEGHRPRHLGGQRRVGLPRDRGAGRAAALHRGARDRSAEGAPAPLISPGDSRPPEPRWARTRLVEGHLGTAVQVRLGMRPRLCRGQQRDVSERRLPATSQPQTRNRATGGFRGDREVPPDNHTALVRLTRESTLGSRPLRWLRPRPPSAISATF